MQFCLLISFLLAFTLGCQDKEQIQEIKTTGSIKNAPFRAKISELEAELVKDSEQIEKYQTEVEQAAADFDIAQENDLLARSKALLTANLAHSNLEEELRNSEKKLSDFENSLKKELAKNPESQDLKDAEQSLSPLKDKLLKNKEEIKALEKSKDQIDSKAQVIIAGITKSVAGLKELDEAQEKIALANENIEQVRNTLAEPSNVEKIRTAIVELNKAQDQEELKTAAAKADTDETVIKATFSASQNPQDLANLLKEVANSIKNKIVDSKKQELKTLENSPNMKQMNRALKTASQLKEDLQNLVPEQNIKLLETRFSAVRDFKKSGLIGHKWDKDDRNNFLKAAQDYAALLTESEQNEINPIIENFKDINNLDQTANDEAQKKVQNKINEIQLKISGLINDYQKAKDTAQNLEPLMEQLNEKREQANTLDKKLSEKINHVLSSKMNTVKDVEEAANKIQNIQGFGTFYEPELKAIFSSDIESQRKTLLDTAQLKLNDIKKRREKAQKAIKEAQQTKAQAQEQLKQAQEKGTAEEIKKAHIDKAQLLIGAHVARLKELLKDKQSQAKNARLILHIARDFQDKASMLQQNLSANDEPLKDLLDVLIQNKDELNSMKDASNNMINGLKSALHADEQKKEPLSILIAIQETP